MLIKPVIIEDLDFCTNCGTKHSIQCYTVYNKALNYKSILDQLDSGKEIEETLGKNELAYMMCTRCKKKYKIQWNTENMRPEPMRTNIFINHFLDNY